MTPLFCIITSSLIFPPRKQISVPPQLSHQIKKFKNLSQQNIFSKWRSQQRVFQLTSTLEFLQIQSKLQHFLMDVKRNQKGHCKFFFCYNFFLKKSTKRIVQHLQACRLSPRLVWHLARCVIFAFKIFFRTQDSAPKVQLKLS